MKRCSLLTAAALALSLCACTAPAEPLEPSQTAPELALVLSDQGVSLDGQAVTEDTEAVTLTHDIVYYEEGHGTEYGEGTADEAHSPEEAAAHDVVTIRQPGTYRLSGSLSAGQIAVDLGKEAKRDPDAAVTLILDGVDVTCTVAPALIFYNVYECDTAWVAYDEEETADFTATALVDTSDAGARVVISDSKVNNFTGSHVARIYKEGTTKKLHKYDGAFYSRMTMEIGGGETGDGVLNIAGDNEGLNSELHLALTGGVIHIQSQDDGINTNEDGVSVTAVKGGSLTINAGLGAEGDGIDSNGFLVFEGGVTKVMANEQSPDGGIDADLDILVNGGQLVALGNMNGMVSSQSEGLYLNLSFSTPLSAGAVVELKDPDGNVVLSFAADKSAQSAVAAHPDLAREVAYTLWVDGVQQEYTGTGGGFMMGGPGGMEPPGGFGGQLPEGMEPPEGFDGQMPEGMEPPEGFGGQMPEGMEPPEGFGGQMPEGFEPPEGTELPADLDGQRPERPGRSDRNWNEEVEGTAQFILTEEQMSFSGIRGIEI